VGLVVSIVSAGVEVHHWRIDAMWHRRLSQRPSRHVVCFVVLIVVGRGDVRVLGTEVASGPVLFHVEPPSIGARLVAERSPQLIIRATEDWCRGCNATRLHVRVLFDRPWMLGQTLVLVSLLMMRKQLLVLKSLAERDAVTAV